MLRSRSIPGARRASTKAQISLEGAARKLEDARDRWAALMQGIAIDLNIESAALVEQVEALALAVALEQLEDALLACRAALTDRGGPPLEALESAKIAVERLRAEAPAAAPPADPGPGSRYRGGSDAG